jgi:hypothetical protein
LSLEASGCLTFWQTTHRGRPSASSHSPGPKGKLTSLSTVLLTPPPSRLFPPRPLSRQPIMTSSIFSLQSSSSETRRVLSSRIQSRNCRSQNHGCDQSRSTTMRVLGMVWGVKRGCSNGVKDGEGSARRYRESRARISFSVSIAQAFGPIQGLHTFMVCV